MSLCLVGSHAWLGDLLTTCFGSSRNRYFGELIGKGMKVEDAVQKLEGEKKRSEVGFSSHYFSSVTMVCFPHRCYLAGLPHHEGLL